MSEIRGIEVIIQEWKNYEGGISISEMHRLVEYLFSLLEKAEKRVKELETDLKLNASMLAKQTDLAREAEIKVKELEEAVWSFLDTSYIDIGLNDIQLCKLREVLEKVLNYKCEV